VKKEERFHEKMKGRTTPSKYVSKLNKAVNVNRNNTSIRT
jgi:hypothetical protein